MLKHVYQINIHTTYGGRSWPGDKTVAVQIPYGGWIVIAVYAATSALFMVAWEIAHDFLLYNQLNCQGALRLFSLGVVGRGWP